ncbi:hypothetical protein, partial [Paracraurococcus lichenis]
ARILIAALHMPRHRPARLALQPRRAVLGEALADAENPGLGQPDLGCDRGLGLPCLTQPDHLSPALLLRLWRQAPHVHVLHDVSYLGTTDQTVKNAAAGSIGGQ